jgi:hypothetical protein
MGNVVNNSTSESTPFDSIDFKEILRSNNEQPPLENDCEYTIDIGKCSTECGDGTQNIRYLITKNPSKSGKSCPVDYIQKCNQKKCESSQISFINILNVPKQESTGSKLFSINLNNVFNISLKEGFYISIEYYSFFPVNFQIMSISINDHIFPISSSILEKDEGYFKHTFLITSSVKLNKYSDIILNLFIYSNSQPRSYTMQINTNSPQI